MLLHREQWRLKKKGKGGNTKVESDLQMPETGKNQGKDLYKNLSHILLVYR